MSLNDYEFIKSLGKGSFGSVMLVKNKKKNVIYAMKRINLSNSDKKEIEASLNEIRLLYSLNHPNIIGYKESFFDEPSYTLNIVLEYADDGDLLKKINYNKKKHLLFSENTIWEWAIQLINGVKYLHSSKVIHRDLKTANIFLMKNGTMKIGDLNVSKYLKNDYARTVAGTPYYIAPEVWEDFPYDYKCDVWSLGCIIYELCTLNPPFRGTNYKELSNNIKSGFYIPISKTYSNDLKKVINLMLQTNPKKRISANDLFNLPIVQSKIKNKNIIIQKMSQKDILIKTIKMPKKISQINKVLPDKKATIIEMSKHDPYESVKKSIRIIEDKFKFFSA